MRKLFRAILDILRGKPLVNAREAMKYAMQDLSRRTAEAEYHSLLANFHTDQALSLDPHVSWWEFAEHKQQAQNHQEDWAVEHNRMLKAQAVVDACKERYNSLRSNP